MVDHPAATALTLSLIASGHGDSHTGMTRDAELDFLDQYYDLLGGLAQFIRLGNSEA